MVLVREVFTGAGVPVFVSGMVMRPVTTGLVVPVLMGSFILPGRAGVAAGVTHFPCLSSTWSLGQVLLVLGAA